jgi:hypothetical protein
MGAADVAEPALLQITRSSSMASCWAVSDNQDSACEITIGRSGPLGCQDAICCVRPVALRVVHGNSPLPRAPSSNPPPADGAESVQN